MTTAQRIHLHVLVFGTGLVILGVELAASRLMAPFFRAVSEHLSARGVVIMNVARPSDDQRLVNALATTLDQVFPSIFLVHLRGTSSATILVGTKQPATEADFRANAEHARGLAHPLVFRAGEGLTTSYTSSVVLTDDRAPVERLMDLMLFREIARRGL